MALTSTTRHGKQHCTQRLRRGTEAAAVLIDNGANVNAVNLSGRTPLHFLAASIDDGKLAELMIRHGAHVNVDRQEWRDTVDVCSKGQKSSGGRLATAEWRPLICDVVRRRCARSSGGAPDRLPWRQPQPPQRRNERPGAANKCPADVERYLWRRLTLVTFVGWAMFAAGPRPVSLVGVLILTLGQWTTLRSRLPVSGYWLLFYPFCLLLGHVLGDLVGGNVQNVLDDVPGLSGGIRYLGPGETTVELLLIASVLGGGCVGCLLGLGQWLLVRPTAANAVRAIVGHAAGLAMASASYAIIHIPLQRTQVGLMRGRWAGVFSILGGYPSPAFHTFMLLFLRACSGVVAGVVAGIAMGDAGLVPASSEKEPLPVSNAAAIGSATGACAVLAIVLGTALLDAYPPAPGHKSAYFSEAFPILALLSLGSWFCADRLLRGVRALRSVKIHQEKGAGRSLAWIGAVTGGLIAALLLLCSLCSRLSSHDRQIRLLDPRSV